MSGFRDVLIVCFLELFSWGEFGFYVWVSLLKSTSDFTECKSVEKKAFGLERCLVVCATK